ncbi:nucleotidyl transferase AbiEii/AbiGii toxin family protein, partial [Patescibacteria group bacterium]|nr:nucleotidyl transferase AbiEii/AbiGii toxin family protein [Patescibacteria group bacterium]
MKDEILNQNQKKIIKKMEFLKNNFYLAGGTALALQLGHRTSKDFDFYSKKDFDSKKLYLDFKKEFSKDISEPIYSENTLEFKIGITDISFFKYPYNLIGPFDNYKLLLLANIKDIAAMKVEAIIGRGTKRDFIDIYFLIKKFS